MNPKGQKPMLDPSAISPRHGFTESHAENMLRDSVLLGAALTGAMTVLVLQDESGIWYRDASELTGASLADLCQALESGLGGAETGNVPSVEQGLLLLESRPLMDDCQRGIGHLYTLSKTPMELSETQHEGMKLLAEHIQTIVVMDQHKVESRSIPRPPAAASFVPGLVHELGSFIFGISANLDAFEARFAGMDEVSKYGASIRKSLDRMSAFIVELREYGYPQRLSWSLLDPELLLRAGVEEHRVLAAQQNIDLQISIEGTLPFIQADEDSLRTAFARVVGLVLHQQEPGNTVVLQVASSHQGTRSVICGHMDFSSVRFKDVDPARLFEPFYFRISGLGRLTLPGARRVFESHGGTLTAGLEPGGGMRVSFMLPAEVTQPLRPVHQP